MFDFNTGTKEAKKIEYSSCHGDVRSQLEPGQGMRGNGQIAGG
jgi:hypothetical protein